MQSNLSMLTLPGKAQLVKLCYQNREFAAAALQSCRHRKGIRTDRRPMISFRIDFYEDISKFETTGCLEDRFRNGRPSASANATKTVQEEMDVVAGSSTHEEVNTREITRCTGIPFSTY